MQSLLRIAFPPQCVSCGALVEETFGLCGPCWRDTRFVTGLVCDQCGAPLPGESDGQAELCDDCMSIGRPWAHGRAALLYRDNARRLVLALKHGDRLDLVRPAARWMAGVAGPCLDADSVIVPVPAHYLRLLRRRYNQSAALAQAVAKSVRRPCLPDLLRRSRRTRMQDGMSLEDRFRNLSDAIRPARNARDRLAGRAVLLVDDVMTSGATLAACAEAAHAAGARQVCVLVLARVAKDA
ncbi:double zinc ribbon domain-containing protein [Psychromarinibacter sp. C21-152]|uniref:Double zinc ribbon domain-containing protein n=1 Tax=Psychromarinibacter sediminicola TaxID=3033385 RepID=A0AAE3NP58_9RHOB|nr:double zinc ribbon domain-containing protein [Psychromarinibacter sediminicola]MDF0601608.1 double zinc ribbon domain-containing protein [Psychromarinibacter sediminicola]